MKAALLDSDTISELLKQRNAVVDSNAANYLQHHSAFAFSAMSRFEVRRGLLERSATVQLTKFDSFCGKSLIFAIDDAVLEKAIELWVIARHGGWPNDDADLLIGATAIVQQRELVTGNTNHYSWMPGIRLIDWRQ